MSFFGGKKSAVVVSEAQEAKPEDLGVVIHVMPKDFFGKEAKLRVEAAPVVAPPVVAAPIAPRPPLAPLSAKRRVPIALWVVLILVVLLGGGAVAYVMLTKTPRQTVVTPPPVTTLPATTTPTPVVTKPTTPTAPTQSKDSDSDGLTDIEERMYGTDYRNPDSDGDTFLDGNEVFHRYDPNGLSPSTLLDTGAVKMFSDTTLPFTVFYPTSWKASVDAATRTVTFKTPNLASVIVTWGTKEKDLTVEDWVLKNVKDADITTLKASYTKEGYYTLRSKDDLVAYLDLGTAVYTMTYSLNGSTEISYIQTFAMMVNSFHISP
ncbi:MAG: hypothetical protein AAB473_01675 [Patescibacteria group bacterium]